VSVDSALIESIDVIDTDCHIIEPPDLWTSRLPSRWQDLAPRVDPDPGTSALRWHVGDEWLSVVAMYAMAGWREFPPSRPPSLEEADPSTWLVKERLARMDEYGIFAQVLYPNLLGFDTSSFLKHGEEFSLACVQAYNDYLTEEYLAAAPDRFIAIASIPFWDVDASIVEIERCAANGHKGILFANRYEKAGLPSFTDRHWDPIYAAAQDMDLSINFHIGFQPKPAEDDPVETALRAAGQSGTRSDGTSARHQNMEMLSKDLTNRELRASWIPQLIPLLMSNADTIISLLTSDVCERFPRTKFVSVESGFGYVPYLLDAIDWQWSQLGGRDAFPERLLPSEYFVRQCYGTFWFEKNTLPLLETYPDNFMFETDFPHPTSLSPGPASYSDIPRDHIKKSFSKLPEDVVRKALHDNAAYVYLGQPR
jgi:predicted TIM-barrel fold metal-dependent hydrolase